MINTEIWHKKYRFGDEKTFEDTALRVAKHVSDGDKTLAAAFYDAMVSLKFIPGGRILAYAGTGNPKATFSNCYVLGEIEDCMEGIMKSLGESALTMKAGGGIGMNFSTLRPYGDRVGGTNSIASGPVSFMEMWNAMSRTISGVGDRKGAMIAVLNADHPDIEDFIIAKKDNTGETPVLEKFNISVGISDDFMEAVRDNSEWDLRYQGAKHKTVKAGDLFRLIVENNWGKAEPGVMFVDTINGMNNLWYCEKINASNPCGELPMPPYGACNLGSINLTQFVDKPFTEDARIDIEGLTGIVKTAVRFLDNVIDLNYYPIPEQREKSLQTRRIGLGVMGLGSMLAMMGVRYGNKESLEAITKIFASIRDTAYRTSIELAKEKGAFPAFDREKYLEGGFIKTFPNDIIGGIKRYGIRNSHLLTIAPTGTTAQLAGNVSSGVEPLFSIEYLRRNDGQEIIVRDYAWQKYLDVAKTDEVPDFFVTAHDLSWREHIAVMAECQKYIDSAISKTINLSQNVTIEEMMDIYTEAWKMGLKGCTVYREGSLDVEILKKKEDKQKVHDGKADRPYQLEGKTFKVKAPENKHAFYLTFTHHNNGSITPYELFINTKDPSVEEWTKALGRLVSAVFRNVDDPTFLADELREIYSHSGFFSASRRKYVPSLIAEFGEVMKDYFREIGLAEEEFPFEEILNGDDNAKSLGYCKVCGQYGTVYEEGCLKCLACGFNKCG
ncbi:MAG: adenosylcobalamin-dependent ribonucleoside-diphosphate reductase [Proteobacteria bacterium]|nr:adenosylcobalamin-dependent ribonucleoside-diphosphate reductase [Pseudomonadota bacterium]